MLGVGKRHIKGYLGLLVVCLIVCLVPVVFLSTISVSTGIVLYFVLPIAFLFLGITYYFFKDKLQASGKPQNNVDEQIQRQYLDSSGRRNNKFVLYLLIVTVSFVVNSIGFMAFEKGIFFLGFIVSVLLLVVGLVGKYFHSEVLDEASYRDDHNPHITEWKEKLRERK